jgi:hypothetical protein
MGIENIKIYSDGTTRRLISKICRNPNCKKEFFTRKGVNGCDYCSRSCKYNEGKVELICKKCGRAFYRQKSKLHLAKHGIHFCSRKCKDEAQRFLGGCREIMPPHYGTANIDRLYKKLIRRTKNPLCCSCLEKRKYLLVVHHIDGDRSNGGINNLEIVCHNCHTKRHLEQIKGEWRYNCHILTSRDQLDML